MVEVGPTSSPVPGVAAAGEAARAVAATMAAAARTGPKDRRESGDIGHDPTEIAPNHPSR